ncbi:hypothetical protein SGGMMB4_05157 [Sodalis glossinidius str. 'morsitans']|uniref:Uncharacterized protein n=1 Tax=Sodalis glossinidius (strain morsitans) TaxID=343509 RepID=A0A193QMU3_SODGM|nr:hypothetical protein SGGMMB4_05157 [Sodalis glossinidius str. 'morsitans']
MSQAEILWHRGVVVMLLVVLLLPLAVTLIYALSSTWGPRFYRRVLRLTGFWICGATRDF